MSKKIVIDTLEYVLASRSWGDNWEKIVLRDVPLDDVRDKEEYVYGLFVLLSGRAPGSDFDLSGVEISDYFGLAGLSLRS